MTNEKKSNHRANIVRINEIISHKNADNLEIVVIGGYQAVVRKGDFTIGDLAVYIQPDSVVPQTEPFRFIWGPYSETKVEDGLGKMHTDVPEKKRRITVRKFRGEWSEGLLLPLKDFPNLADSTCNAGCSTNDPFAVQEGDDVSDLLGITHYDPDAGKEDGQESKSHAPRRKYPKTIKGWFRYFLSKLRLRKRDKFLAETVDFHIPDYDVEAFKNYKGAFEDGEPVIVTEKIHGSNARFVCVDGIMYAGSHHKWKAPGSNCVWRKALAQNPWIEEWCRQHEGFALYGEVTPTQGKYTYGCKTGMVRFFLFDILDANGKWVAYNEWESLGIRPYECKIDTVPLLYVGPFKEEYIKSLVDGPSQVTGADHIREGIVVKSADEGRHVRGLGRLQLKIVSNAFLDKDSKAA